MSLLVMSAQGRDTTENIKRPSSNIESNLCVQTGSQFRDTKKTQVIWKLQWRVNHFLVKLFQNFGRTIGENTSHFIIVPLLLCCLCITGLQQVIFEESFENLALPKKGQWVREREAVDKNFPMNSWNFDPLRVTVLGRYVNVLVTSKRGNNIFSDDLWKEIQSLDKVITHTHIYHEEERFSFFDLCTKWKGRCFSPLYPIKPNVLSGMFNSFRYQPSGSIFPKVNFSLTYPLGGSNFSRHGLLESAEAISLYYWMRSDHFVDVKRSRKWESEIINLLAVYESQNMSVYSYASRTPSDELKFAGERVKPLLALSVFFILVFTAISASMTDWVRSKIFVSLLGIVSSLIATAAAFGLMMYLKVPFIEMNFATVFLMLGIGIDDMFVMLAAWRQTSLMDSVPNRMAETYGHVCISITFTSITNMLAFCLGSFTSIRSIEIFCLYSCISVMMMLVVFLTLFGGCLAASGYLEKNQRHSLFGVKVLPKSESQMKSRWYRIFMSGGINRLKPNDKLDNQPHFGMLFLRNTWGGFLSRPWVKGLTVLTFLVYLMVSLYGVSTLKSEKHPNRVEFLPSTKGYFSVYDVYFKHKASTAQFVMTGRINYSDKETEKEILALHNQLEAEPFVLKNFTISWIRDWYNYLEAHQELRFNLTNEEIFVRLLRTVKDTEKSSYNECDEIIEHFGSLTKLIHSPPDFEDVQLVKDVLSFVEDIPCNSRDIMTKLIGKKGLRLHRQYLEIFNIISWVSHHAHQHDDLFELDIKFQSDFSRIVASRFLVFVEDAQSEHVQKKLREIAAKFPKLGVEVFSHERLVMDEIYLVKKTTILTTVSTTLVVLLVSFILIPSPMCSLWVAVSILSIEVGVIGFMSLWHVRLDAVSMVNLVMCIGFSVDFSAHISYAFLDVKASTVKERIQESIYNVGFPILLGGLSTIIGLVPLWFSDSSIFIKFFKIVFLVIFLGMLHAMTFLPVFMSFMNFSNKREQVHKSKKVEGLFDETFVEMGASPPNSLTRFKYLGCTDTTQDIIYRDDKIYSEPPFYDTEETLMVLNASALARLFHTSDPLKDKIKRF